MHAWASRTLKYSFSDGALLEQALTHRSKGDRNYERLEFLGDSVLNFIIAEELYDRFPDTKEGTLSRLRANLVRKETLATLARQLQVGNHLVLGGGELKSGGYKRDSILSDALEAIIGAIYKDGGLEAARAFLVRTFGQMLTQIDPSKMLKDPKSRLQEFLQERSVNIPTYNVLKIHGEPHKQHFVVECVVDSLAVSVHGEGRSRRIAEQEAAAKAYELLIRPHD